MAHVFWLPQLFNFANEADSIKNSTLCASLKLFFSFHPRLVFITVAALHLGRSCFFFVFVFSVVGNCLKQLGELKKKQSGFFTSFSEKAVWWLKAQTASERQETVPYLFGS